MNDIDFLNKATCFDLGLCKFYERNVTIEARKQMSGDILWVVKMDSWVLGKDAKFHYESMPSNRTDDFIKNTRFLFSVGYDLCLSF